MSFDPAIRIEGLGKCYHIYDTPRDRLKQFLWRGSRNFYREFWALRDVAFDVKKGETIGIIGRNGSGKSTLMKMLAGTLTPTTGTIETQGRVAALLELGSGFNPEFTGRENVFLNGAILGIGRTEMAERFDQIAAFADIGDFIDQPVKTYSSGMVVRLAFAVSVHVNPDILLIDEALSVGDAVFQFKCKERMEQLAASGTTLLFVSHDLGLVRAFCKRVVYLTQGRLVAAGQADDVTEHYLLDMRADQAKALTIRSTVATKPALEGGKGLAFGTSEGRVVSAYFAGLNSTRTIFTTGEKTRIRVSVEFKQSLKDPTVSIMLQDHRMVEIAGRYFRPVRQMTGADVCEVTVDFVFSVDLNAGNYFISVRLEERITDKRFFPIDKQVGALSFEVLPKGTTDRLGIFAMRIDCEVPGEP